MGALTEVEIFDCLISNLRVAAQHSRDLARSPHRGPIYEAFREALGLIEGACRQAAYWRGGDARWLQLGLMMAEAHKRAGTWLRAYHAADSISQVMQPAFMNLASQLDQLLALALQLKNGATGRRGPILPKPGRDPSDRVRPVPVTKTPGGIIIPPGACITSTAT